MPGFPYLSLPNYGMQAGMATPYGILLPPSQNVIYVRSSGVQNTDNRDIAERIFPTLASALQQCRSGLADTVICLPGHSESVTDATMLTNLVAGTKIIGVGNGSNRPTFRWTATAAQWAVSVNDVVFCNLNLQLEGANGVVKAIAVTGNDVVFANNDILVGSGASNKATIALEVGTGASGGNRFVFDSNTVRGVVAGAVTNGLLISNAASDIRIINNEMHFASTTTNGNINCNAAALNIRVLNNYLENTVASSVACIVFSNAASDGTCAYNAITVKNTGAHTSGTTGITIGAACLVGFHQNFSVNDPLKSGVLMPAVDT